MSHRHAGGGTNMLGKRVTQVEAYVCPSHDATHVCCHLTSDISWKYFGAIRNYIRVNGTRLASAGLKAIAALMLTMTHAVSGATHVAQ